MASVVSAEEIASMGVRGMDEVLQNGVPITTLIQGYKGNLWGDYPVELISRLEIIPGPGSALYGSDAFSGVINIITKGPAEVPGTEVGARAGSFGARDAWLQHGGKLGPVDISAYVRIGDTDGWRRTVERDARAPIADYHTVDLALSTRRGKHSWNFAAAVRNLFNANAREPSAGPGLQIPHDLPMAPRAVTLTASYEL